MPKVVVSTEEFQAISGGAVLALDSKIVTEHHRVLEPRRFFSPAPSLLGGRIDCVSTQGHTGG